MRDATDFLVIGGGPAGCAAALVLRSRGYGVVVVDATVKKVRPTETAAPELRNLLEGLAAREVLSLGARPCYGISSNWGRSRPIHTPSILNPRGSAWLINRTEFDKALQDVACRMGVRWVAAIASRVHADGQGASIETDRGFITAEGAIDASGANSRVGLDLGRRQRFVDRLVVFWARIPAASVPEQILSVESAEEGWWYMVPGGHLDHFAGLVTDSKVAQRLSAHRPEVWAALFRKTRFLKTSTEALPDRIQASSYAVGHSDPLFGPRWVAAGDAALGLDPLGSSGLVTALESGRRAARALAATMDGDSSGLRGYEDWAKELFKEFVRQREGQYRLEARRGEFWARRLGLAVSRA